MSNMLTNTLTNKTIIVIGASKNIGCNIAKNAALAGANVICHYHSDSSKQSIDSLEQDLTEQGKSCCHFQADLRSSKQVKQLFDFAEAQFSVIDIIVNTAGLIIKSPLATTNIDDYQNLFDSNVKTTFLLYQETAKRIQLNGRIINFSSSLTAAQRGPGYSVYSAAKAATEQLSKFLADELAHKSVTVNTISPGPIDNSFLQSCESTEGLEFLKTLSVFNRLGNNDDVTPLVLFLMSKQASWITGQNIRVNGGMI